MSRLRSSDGSALVVAVTLLAVMVVGGLAMMTLADGQQRQSRRSSVREAAFTVSEAALDAQVSRLTQRWPLSQATAYPAACDPTTFTQSSSCPDPAVLTTAFQAVDEANPRCGGATAQWRTTVRDNGGAATASYKTATVAAQPTYDANGDGMLWVRSEGRAQCRLRTLTTMVRANEIAVAFPRVTIAANWFWTTNQGRKVIVDTVGSYAQPASIRPNIATAQPAPVRVRCTAPTPSPCVKVEANKGQISGSAVQVGAMQSPAMSDNDVSSLKARARALGTYYAPGTCPANLTGLLVYLEDATGCPAYNGGNTAAAPGVTVVGKGTLAVGGNRVFYGVIYARNEQLSSGAVVNVQGTAAIQGSVVVDGAGGVVAGSSATNVVFDPRALSLIRGLGDAAPVPGTWREIGPSE
jgi:Tfp pilus assembly protein PilX